MPTPPVVAQSLERGERRGRDDGHLLEGQVVGPGHDREAAESGAAAAGAPWRFYDFGHGYCTYDFFDQCSHRMACAKCSFYRPKDSTRAQLLEGKANLLRLKQEIPLTDEVAAVDGGLEALERLCVRLADVPTPAGPTPRELSGGPTAPAPPGGPHSPTSAGAHRAPRAAPP